ncbi:response regulator transcription factor [Gracilibacillus massiliensis]|uniref:response regulator transcription factor n=1 Tax=Gracilibacillus massiliensis TaxID=1564956 RepID=UPI00071E2240|nr:AraC family transcriptional regulator [Gracilibacillus massiliensis]
MYRVVLVDDDKLVTKFLEKMIPWQESGFEVVATFQDSVKALNYFNDHTCDVLITDIGMPHMNGIELITKVKEQSGASYQVILSCHDEFHFAQQALKIGTFDYILKESMEEEDIIAVLERLKETLEQTKKNDTYQEKIKKFMKENNMSLKSKFLETILHIPNTIKESWWQEQEELLEMDFSHESYAVALCFIDNFDQAYTHYENERLLQFSINNVLEEVLMKYAVGVQVFYLNNKFFILFPAKQARHTTIHRMIEAALNEVQSKISSFLSLSITSVIHSGNHQREQLTEVLHELMKHEEQRFYYKHGSLHYFQRREYQHNSIFTSYTKEVDQLKTAILNKDKQSVSIWIQERLEQIVADKYSPKAIIDWAIKLVLDIKISLNALQHFENKPFDSMTSRMLQESENYQVLESLLMYIFQQYIQQVPVNDARSQHEEIIKAKRFVHQHLDQKITLKDISVHLHLNPSYFSRLFKKETGETFIEYVTRIKMEKAMEFLNHSTKTVEEISFELGFDSKSYFLKTFKKATGMSPKAYRYKSDQVSVKDNK